jgi:hypothetical protein
MKIGTQRRVPNWRLSKEGNVDSQQKCSSFSQQKQYFTIMV